MWIQKNRKMPKTKEKEIEDIELGKKEESPYTESGREVELDDDSLTDVDEGFMKGYEKDGTVAKCATCGKILGKDIVEREFDGTIYRFCSGTCADKFEKKRK